MARADGVGRCCYIHGMFTHAHRDVFTGMALALALGAGAPRVAAQTVDEVVARYIEARGGASKIHGLNTIRMTGTISFGPGEPAPFTLEMKRPGRMRTEFAFQGAVGVQAFDGQKAWAVLPMAGKSEPEYLPDEVGREAAEQADIEGPLVDAAAKGNKVELLGTEKVEGRDCFKVMVTFKSGGVRYSYIDAVSFLEAKAEGRRTAGGDEVMLETYYRDYRDVDGLKIPYRVEAGPARRPERQKIVIDRVEVNVPLDDTRFERPLAARRP
jgi:outer membrane lipoprotein-sorting protein